MRICWRFLWASNQAEVMPSGVAKDGGRRSTVRLLVLAKQREAMRERRVICAVKSETIFIIYEGWSQWYGAWTSLVDMNFVHRHSLSIVTGLILVSLIACYAFLVRDASTHFGSFVGNAIADWSGMFMTVLATKYLYEAKRHPHEPMHFGFRLMIHNHPLTLFLLVTGSGWLGLFLALPVEDKWGQVVGNLVSEWTQSLGFVWLTKRFIERKD